MPTKQVTTQSTSQVATRVAPGRCVHVDGQAFGPGETVTLSTEDAARLADLGFVQVGSEQEEEPASSELPAGATVQVQDGARVYQG